MNSNNTLSKIRKLSFYHTGKNQSALAILVHVIVSRLFSSGETNGNGMKPPMKIMAWNLDVNRRFRPSKSIHSFNENNKLFSIFFLINLIIDRLAV